MDKDVITLIDGEKIAVNDFNMWQLRDIGYSEEKKQLKGYWGCLAFQKRENNF